MSLREVGLFNAIVWKSLFLVRTATALFIIIIVSFLKRQLQSRDVYLFFIRDFLFLVDLAISIAR